MSPTPGDADRRGAFASTQWSLVLAAGGATADPASREALAELCDLYWAPVYGFVRRCGHSREEAEDLTQGFFSRLIEKGDLGAADPERGRFRSFLLTACRSYLSNEHDRRQALKRGGDRAILSFDAEDAEGRYQRALAHTRTPELLFRRQWCLTLLARVLEVLAEDYRAKGRGPLFDRLRAELTGPTDAADRAAAARELSLTPGALRVAVHRLRSRYRAELRRQVRETVESDTEVDEELEDLFRALEQ